MSDTVKSKFPDAWATGHVGVISSLNQSDVVAAHKTILGPTRTRMSACRILPQVLNVVQKSKR